MTCPFACGQRMTEELLDAAADDEVVVDETAFEDAELDEVDETELEVDKTELDEADCFKKPAM